MKILHVLSQMPDFTGSGKTVQAIIENACKQGHDNFLVAGIQDGFSLAPSLLPPDHTCFVRFNQGTLDFPLPGMSDVMPYTSTVFSSMDTEQIRRYETAFEKALVHVRKVFDPDLVHTHHLWMVSKIARKVFFDRPLVTSCHGTCLRQFFLCPDLARGVRPAMRDIDAVFCLSRHQKQQIQKIHGIAPQKLHVVGAGFDSTLFYPGEKPEKGPVEILYAGKLSRSKGVPWLLESLGKIKTKSFRCHLAGSGSGQEKQACLDLAAALKGQVIVHGPLPHEDLARLMRKSHLFVLPSFFEGLPLVLLEALSSGCRILTTSLPGACEMFENFCSDMVDLVALPPLETIDTPYRKDMPDLVQILSAALENSIIKADENRQPDLEAVKAICASFTWQNVFLRMEQVYEMVATRIGGLGGGNQW